MTSNKEWRESIWQLLKRKSLTHSLRAIQIHGHAMMEFKMRMRLMPIVEVVVWMGAVSSKSAAHKMIAWVVYIVRRTSVLTEVMLITLGK